MRKTFIITGFLSVLLLLAGNLKSSSTSLEGHSKISGEQSSSLINRISGEYGFRMSFEQKSTYTFTNKPRILKGTVLFSP
jgi:hypothetical protein